VSRQAGYLLDVEDPFSHAYTLEVSSPGMDRKLKRISDFRKAVGKRVKVKTIQSYDGEKAIEGVIEKAGEDSVGVRVTEQRLLEIPYSDIVQARLVVEGVSFGKGEDRDR
jgi:ribosome maturation factor RimP